jgi:thiol-disulfide isomerase/thioredoxin
MKKPCLATALGLVFACQNLSPAAEVPNAIIAPHAKDLVVLQGEKLVPFESAQFLKAPYTIIYFGAGWFPDCRRFSPALAQAYNQQPNGVDRFEVLFFSMDKSAEGMLKFIKSEKMLWPALAFDKLPTAEELKKYYSGHGIPCLSVIDPKGKLLLQSKSDQDAQEVLNALQDQARKPEIK